MADGVDITLLHLTTEKQPSQREVVFPVHTAGTRQNWTWNRRVTESKADATMLQGCVDFLTDSTHDNSNCILTVPLAVATAGSCTSLIRKSQVRNLRLRKVLKVIAGRRLGYRASHSIAVLSLRV